MIMLLIKSSGLVTITGACDCGVVIGVPLTLLFAFILIVVCSYAGYQLGKDNK